ncbi:MAG: hypothetical protein Q9170_007288 [Blastenia crenularia]
MDEAETDDGDIKLQRDSIKTIRELKTSVPLFLYKTTEPVKIRKIVKRSNTDRLEKLFNIFQGDPTLLDPALKALVEPLVSAFQVYVENYSDHYPRGPIGNEDLVEPLPRAVCRLLYTLCKVRRAKVIVNFLNNESTLLEHMLDAFENWNIQAEQTEDESSIVAHNLTWEEKYVMLLWLSHLVNAPSDLASISTSEIDPSLQMSLPFEVPGGIPSLAIRLLTLAIPSLVSASKEREGAKILLVRLCFRPDMIRLGLHSKCMDWALKSLKDMGDGSNHVSFYFNIGIVSFLAGFFKKGSGDVVAPFLQPVFDCLQSIIAGQSDNARTMYGSAVVRKLFVSLYRSFAVHLLRKEMLPVEGRDDNFILLGTVIDHLMNSLEDKQDLVRSAASKALSMVAERLDSDMTVQIVDDIIGRLQKDVTMRSIEIDEQVFPSHILDIFPSHVLDPALVEFEFSSVDQSQWQGLILALSSLIFQRSMAPERLAMAVRYILRALNFEQRSSTGASTGFGVRYAACFGIWSLARKCTTRELLKIAASSIRLRRNPRTHVSIFEVLAAELVLAATLDPEGNIRRAASAALQELVGRHPDLVPKGIALVQVVDYQAVGLRSRAMLETTLRAAEFDELYLYAIADGLLSWRAISSSDIGTRRDAASTVGEIYRLHGDKSLSPFYARFYSPQVRSVDEWHGLYMALSAAVCSCPASMKLPNNGFDVLGEDGPLSVANIVASGNDANVAAEALSTMIHALGALSKSREDLTLFAYHISIVKASLEHCSKVPEACLSVPAVVFKQLHERDQKEFLIEWLAALEESVCKQGNSTVSCHYIEIIGSIFDNCRDAVDAESLEAILEESAERFGNVLLSLLSKKSAWETRAAALKHLFIEIYVAYTKHYSLDDPIEALVHCLNDYSVFKSKDVGSKIRIQAIEVIGRIDYDDLWYPQDRNKLFSIIYGLAVGSNDNVRYAACSCIESSPKALDTIPEKHRFVKTLKTSIPSTSSTEYFELFLSLWGLDVVDTPILEGLITSASSSSDSTCQTARKAIVRFISGSSLDDSSQASSLSPSLLSPSSPSPLPPPSHSQTIDSFYRLLIRTIQANAPPARGRLLRPGLELLAFLLEVDVCPRLVDEVDE